MRGTSMLVLQKHKTLMWMSVIAFSAVVPLSHGSAEGVSASAGNAVQGEQSSCMNMVWGGMRNDCAEAGRFEIPLTVNRGGAWKVWLFVVPSAAEYDCFVYSQTTGFVADGPHAPIF